MGQATFGQQVSAGASVGSSLAATLVATGAIAGPVGAAIGAGVGLVATLVNALFAPNYNNIAATNDVNSIEPNLKANLANWLSLSPDQKTVTVQAAAVAVAQGWIAKMQQLCSQVPGSAGQNCISQRMPGGCGFHVAAPYGWINGSFVPSGPNDPTGAYCWDWGYYVDSISQDPNVVPDPADTTATTLISGTSQAAASPTSVVAAPGGAVLTAGATSSLSVFPWWVWVAGIGLMIWAAAS